MKKNPNIIFILIDDMGYKDLSIYGSSFYETPNIDSIGYEGMQFSNGYAASPVCSPARASIMTGKYPLRVNVTHYLGSGTEKGKCVGIRNGEGLDPKEINIARTLKENNNYQTWHVGKWHLGEDESYWPLNQGFDVNVGGSGFGHPYKGFFSPYHIPNLTDGEDGEYLTDRLTDEAINLIKTRNTDKPFYLNMWYYSVHIPIQAKPETIKKYEEKRIRLGLDKEVELLQCESFPWEDIKHMNVVRRQIQSDPVYAAMIEELDTNIGKLLTTLKEEGLEDTLIIFTSDNGGLATSEDSPTTNAPYRDGKGWMYEGGVKEPLLIKWTGEIEPGSKSEVQVTSPDFFPTLMEITDTKSDYDNQDGRSFTAALKGAEYKRDAMYWHYPHYGNQGGQPYSSIVEGDYKLIYFYETDEIGLYNIKEDISETKDIKDEYPKIKEKLFFQLNDWIYDNNAKIPLKNPDWV